MTLIEILVAVTLMGMLAAAMVTALTVGANSWRNVRSWLTLDHRIASANEILYAQFEGIVPVATEPDGSGNATPRAAFFQGQPESMRFVTQYSLTQGTRGGLRIVELLVTEGPRGRRVILNELPYGGPASLGRMIAGVESDATTGAPVLVFAPIHPRGTSLIIADELQECRFSYLKLPHSWVEPAMWVPQWADISRLPGAIRVEIAAASADARLLPVTITAPVRARSSLSGGAPSRGAR